MSAGSPPEAQRALVVSVSEFSQRLRDVFRRVRAFEYLGVSGEISEWTPKPNGIYFTLKDAGAVLQCFAYSNRAGTFPNVAAGAAIIAYGTIRVAEWRSRYELLVETIALTGIGELHKQLEELKERFRRLGFFDAGRKRPIPPFPRSVVLVSARGKGAEDFLKTLRESAPQVRAELLETRVQGAGADVEIADAIDRASRRSVDVVVLARGGGSYEDLFAFNREAVVRAVMRSTIPVITGIGHTDDHHLADEVADLACKTPLDAAKHIVGLWLRGREHLQRLEQRLDREMRVVISGAAERADDAGDALTACWGRSRAKWRERIAAAELRLATQSPTARVAVRAQRLSAASATLRAWPGRAMPQWGRACDIRVEQLRALRERFTSDRTNALAIVAARLVSADPQKPLERGYAIVERAGRALHDARDAAVGEAITARLHHGSLDARVERITSDE